MCDCLDGNKINGNILRLLITLSRIYLEYENIFTSIVSLVGKT